MHDAATEFDAVPTLEIDDGQLEAVRGMCQGWSPDRVMEVLASVMDHEANMARKRSHIRALLDHCASLVPVGLLHG